MSSASGGLGNTHNYLHLADSVIVDMGLYHHATVYVYESSAEAVISMKRRLDGGAAVVAPDFITEYWTCTGDGSDVWARQTQTAADEVTKTSAAAQSLCAIEVHHTDLISDGGDYNQLEVEVDGSAVVNIVLGDLAVKRAPQNLPVIAQS